MPTFYQSKFFNFCDLIPEQKHSIVFDFNLLLLQFLLLLRDRIKGGPYFRLIFYDY